MKILFLSALAFLSTLSMEALACTNIIVGKAASADGSVMVTYNDDSYGKFGFLDFYPAAKHAPGDVRRIISWENGQYRGTIPEIAQTYNVVGNINEYQVCICETTFGGRRELINPEGLIDYGSLIYIALQRSKTAQEAISVMTSLVDEFGYCSSGETFSICDKNEAWIMEMVGKGPGQKGALWVAVRIPDDCVAVHANSSRITRFDLKDKQNVKSSKDVITYARQQGWYDGKDAEFSFRDTYAPKQSIRSCEARCWSFMNRMDSTLMADYLPYILQEEGAPQEMPLYIKPTHKVTLPELKDCMRDHYEGTPLAFTDDLGAGAWGMPYRPRPVNFNDAEGNTYFNERPISTQQTAFTLVSQLRSWLPDAVGGVMWFGCDDANMVAYTPVYCCTNQIPVCYDRSTASAVDFTMKSAFWLCNMLSNIVYQRYSLMMPDLQKVQSELERNFEFEQENIVAEALKMSESDRVTFLTQQTSLYADKMMDRWQQLLGYVVIKYNDMVIKNEVDGRFDTFCHEKCHVSNPGYPEAYREKIIRETGTRYRVPETH